jgi:hypothetical protein
MLDVKIDITFELKLDLMLEIDAAFERNWDKTHSMKTNDQKLQNHSFSQHYNLHSNGSTVYKNLWGILIDENWTPFYKYSWRMSWSFASRF